MHFQGVLCTVTFATLASAAVAKQVPTPGWDKYAGEREAADVAARAAEPEPEAEADPLFRHPKHQPWILPRDAEAEPEAEAEAEAEAIFRHPKHQPWILPRDAEAEPEAEAEAEALFRHPKHQPWILPRDAMASPEAEAAWSSAHGGPPPSYAYDEATELDSYPTPLASHAANWASQLSSLAANAVPTLNARDAEAEPKMPHEVDPIKTHAPSHTGGSWAHAAEWRKWLSAHPQPTPHQGFKEGVKHAARAVADAVGLDSDDEIEVQNAQWQQEFLEEHGLEARDIDFGPHDGTVYPYDEALERRDVDDDEEVDYSLEGYGVEDDGPVAERDVDDEEVDYSQEGYGIENIAPYDGPIAERDVSDDEEVDYSQEGYGVPYDGPVAERDVEGEQFDYSQEGYGEAWIAPYDGPGVERRDADEEIDYSEEGYGIENIAPYDGPVVERDVGDDEEVDYSQEGYGEEWIAPYEEDQLQARDAEPDARNVFMPGMGAHPSEMMAAAAAKLRAALPMAERDVEENVEEIYPYYDEANGEYNLRARSPGSPVKVGSDHTVPVSTLTRPTQKSKWFPW